MDIQIRKTEDSFSAYEIAKQLPDFFDARGLEQIKTDTQSHELFGAFDENKMLGFVVYKEINPETIEMAWIGVSPDAQTKGVGTKLVEESLGKFSSKYKVCEVKTLSEIDSYGPYKKTREFYKKLNFIPIETISPYPGWGDNPCQIFVRFL
jgi:ribosomal protein S18 acetylase RimI-like enzyme